MFFTKKINSTYSSTLKDTYSLACKTQQIEDNKYQRELISTFEENLNYFASAYQNL